jgi:GNAT superfamily N-acetyltransferase
MTIRRATAHDAELLATHRAAVWIEVGDWARADLEPQVAVWTAYFAACLRNETYVAFIAEHEGHSAGSGAVLVQASIPRPGFASDRAGRVQSVYVEPEMRHKGVARAIMERLLDYAREAKLISLSLHPSDPGRALYAALGFEAADEMTLRLTAE